MLSIVLQNGFDRPLEEIRRLATESHATGEPLNVEIVIDGQLYFRDGHDLAGQFLYAAYVGQSIADACTEFDCTVPTSIAAHESVEFDLVPKNVDEFVEKFWNSIVGYMDSDLLEQLGIWDVHAAEAREVGWDYLDKPKLALHTAEIVEHAREILAVSEDDEGEDHDEDED